MPGDDARTSPDHPPPGANEWWGRRLPTRVRIGKPSVESTGELPYRFQRLQAIEALVERHTRRLEVARDGLRDRTGGDGERFAAEWQQLASKWRFDELNELIDEHNEWFPIEAKLPWDHRAQDYRALFGIPWRRQRLDAGWILERFPSR